MEEEDKEKIKKITSCLINAVVEQYSLVTKLAEETFKNIAPKYSDEEILEEIINTIKKISIPQNIPVPESDFKEAIIHTLLSFCKKKERKEERINVYA